MSELAQWQKIQGMLRGYREAQVLITAAELGIFEQLAARPQTAADLATSTGSDPAALTRLLNAAVGLDLIQIEDGRYKNGLLATACLIPGATFYMGRQVAREGAFYRRWSHLTEAVRTGHRPQENVKDEAAGDWVRNFELALFDLARVYGPAVAAALDLPTDRPLRILDVGGGHGGYSMALVQHYPQARATVFELPAAAAVGRDIIAENGMSERVEVVDGDFQKEELGEGYDLILLFGVLVSETPEGKIDLLRKTYRALAPGGRAAIREFLLDDERTGPGQGPLFSLHMLLSTDAGDLATTSDMTRWVEAAGFLPPHFISLPEFEGAGVYVVEK